MKQYLYSIVAVSIIAALFRVLCPAGTALKKYFSFLTSATLLCTTVIPVASLVQGFSQSAELFTAKVQTSNADYDTLWLETLSNTAEKETEHAVISLVCDKFSLSENNVSAVCNFDESDGHLRLSSIEITLHAGALLKNPRRIENYLTESFGLPCTVRDGSIRSPE